MSDGETRKPPVAIYGLHRPDGPIRYVGKANDPRKRLSGHMRETRLRSPLYLWFGKLRSEGITPQMTVLEWCDATDWQKAERKWIAHYRSLGPLLNLADGGDEPHCPIDVRRSNGAKVAAIRMPNLNRAYKMLDYGIREAKKRSPHKVEHLEARKQLFVERVNVIRREGNLDVLDWRLGEMFERIGRGTPERWV